LREAAAHVRAIVVVELSAGQMIDDVRLAVGEGTPIYFHGRTGGMVPTPTEVAQTLLGAAADTEPDYWVPDDAGIPTLQTPRTTPHSAPSDPDEILLRPVELFE